MTVEVQGILDTKHTTTAITINENESRRLNDFENGPMNGNVIKEVSH